MKFVIITYCTYDTQCLTVHAGIAITLTPSGTTSVCPGGQALLLTCERMPPGSILYWRVSVPHLDTTLERIVLSQGSLLSPEFKIEFNITRTSKSPLIGQLLIRNVTTETTVYCSEDGDENNAPMTTINVVGSIPSKILSIVIIT